MLSQYSALPEFNDTNIATFLADLRFDTTALRIFYQGLETDYLGTLEQHFTIAPARRLIIQLEPDTLKQPFIASLKAYETLILTYPEYVHNAIWDVRSNVVDTLRAEIDENEDSVYFHQHSSINVHENPLWYRIETQTRFAIDTWHNGGSDYGIKISYSIQRSVTTQNGTSSCWGIC
jgi:hypothetical protein